MDRSALLPQPPNNAVSEDAPSRRLTVHFRRRLARLLADGVDLGEELEPSECQELRRRALVATIRSLTDLGDGEAASNLLREAQRR